MCTKSSACSSGKQTVDQASSALILGQLQLMELKAKGWVQAAPGVAKCSVSMASRVAPLYRSSLPLFPPPEQFLPHVSSMLIHHISNTNAQAALACLHTSTYMHAHMHACTCMCGCAVGTNTRPNKL